MFRRGLYREQYGYDLHHVVQMHSCAWCACMYLYNAHTNESQQISPITICLNIYKNILYIHRKHANMWIRGYQLDIVCSLGLCSCGNSWRLCSGQRCDMRLFWSDFCSWGSWAKGALDLIPLATGWLMLSTWYLGVVPAWCLFAPPTSGQLCRSGVRVQSTFQSAIIRCRIL